MAPGFDLRLDAGYTIGNVMDKPEQTKRCGFAGV